MSNAYKKYDFSRIQEPIIPEDLKGKIDELIIDSPLVGTISSFGKYVQSRDGKEKTPIEWIIVEEVRAPDNTFKLLALSRYALDARRFESGLMKVAWNDCSLRRWLNEEFYNTAFSPTEKEGIIQRYSIPDKLQEKSSKDRVFLLSVHETMFRFLLRKLHQYRICEPTEYVKRKKASTQETCAWWLRSPGSDYDKASYVSADGEINRDGISISSEIGIRPAIWIKKEALSSEL